MITAVRGQLGTALCREFFGQGWMKLEKNERTPYIMKNTKHFNDVSGAAGWDGNKNGACGTWVRVEALPEALLMLRLLPPEGQQLNCVRDPAQRGAHRARQRHREVGGGSRHLPLPAQLQRRAGDHLLPQPQRDLPPQENLAEGLQAGGDAGLRWDAAFGSAPAGGSSADGLALPNGLLLPCTPVHACTSI